MANQPLSVTIAQNKSTPIVVGALVVVGLVVAYFGIIKPILVATGLKESKYDEELPKKKGFNPEYYKTNLSKVTISTATANRLAEDVYDSYGFAFAESRQPRNRVWSDLPFDDKEELLQGAIQSAGSEYNLSKVSDVFQKKYNQGMIAYIKNFADNSDTKAISRIIKEYKG